MKKVKILLSLAVVLGVLSITPLATEWQILSSGASAADGHALQWAIDAWRDVVDWLRDGQLISSARAYDWRTNGIAVDELLQALALAAVVLGWIASLGSRSEPPAAHAGPEIREAAVGISQIQHAMTNVLLNPQAQGVAEPLTDIARQLHSVGDVLSSMQTHRRD